MARRGGPFSERAFHRWLADHLPAGRSGALPLGDDVAAVRLGNVVALLTTDALVEGTHFLARSPPRWVGRAAAAASLSDIAAKGGRPVALLLDLLLPRTTPSGWARAVALGAESMMAEFGGHLLGGDTKESSRRAVVGSILGVADPHHLPPRTGARPGDLLVVTGTVGRGGLAALATRRPDGPRAAELQAMLDLRPRVREGQALAPVAHAMLDTSDGLAAAGHLLAQSSRVRVTLDTARIPWDPALSGRVPELGARTEVGFFGGDYELLAAVPARRLPQAKRNLARVKCPWAVIGTVAKGSGAWLEERGRTRPLPREGWDPFGNPRRRLR